MRISHLVCTAATVASTLSVPCLAGTTLALIPGAASANDMSPDARFIVGATTGGNPYLYDTVLDSMTMLPAPGWNASAVSDDGTVVLGNIIDPETNAEFAAIWTAESNVWTSLGSFPTGVACPSYSSGYELSNDGKVAVGLGWINGCSAVGFRWTEATGMVQLEQLANGGNRASVVNLDGSVIGGFAQGSFSRTPAFWTPDGGVLLDPPDGDTLGEVYGLNRLGTILLGSADGKAVRWTDGGSTMTVLGAGSILPGWTGVAMDRATNGTTVGFDFIFGNRRAWLQLGGDGPLIELQSYLEANGATVPVPLEVCQAISADGRTIIGHGFSGAWMATIETPALCTGDIAPLGGDGLIDGADLGVLLSAWGTGGADLNGDGATNGADLGVLLGNWGSCVPVVGACCLGSGCDSLTAEECAAAGGNFLGAGVPCTPAVCNANDHCANAIDITSMMDGTPFAADNSLATPGFGGGDPELPTGSPSCQWSGEPFAAHSTIWFTFMSPSSGFVVIRMCDEPSTIIDSTMAIFDGPCGSLVEVACDEDSCTETLFLSEIITVLEPDRQYTLCIMNAGGWSGSTPGSFTLSIEGF